MSDIEQKIVNALNDTRWDWRSLGGLQRSTNLPAATILEFLVSNRSRVVFGVSSRSNDLVFTLKTKAPRSGSLFQRFLDFLTLGSRNTKYIQSL
jgi:hypothetical protein